MNPFLKRFLKNFWFFIKVLLFLGSFLAFGAFIVSPALTWLMSQPWYVWLPCICIVCASGVALITAFAKVDLELSKNEEAPRKDGPELG